LEDFVCGVELAEGLLKMATGGCCKTRDTVQQD
jgi:hypothetical protein